MQGVATKLVGEVVPLDGKRLRRSHDRSQGQAAIELVSAWASSQRLTLGQVKVADDSNEITAVPESLKALSLAGCSVTVAALNTQKATVEAIVEQGADYVVALKGPGPGQTLHEFCARLTKLRPKL